MIHEKHSASGHYILGIFFIYTTKYFKKNTLDKGRQNILNSLIRSKIIWQLKFSSGHPSYYMDPPGFITQFNKKDKINLTIFNMKTFTDRRNWKYFGFISYKTKPISNKQGKRFHFRRKLLLADWLNTSDVFQRDTIIRQRK